MSSVTSMAGFCRPMRELIRAGPGPVEPGEQQAVAALPGVVVVQLQRQGGFSAVHRAVEEPDDSAAQPAAGGSVRRNRRQRPGIRSPRPVSGRRAALAGSDGGGCIRGL